MDELPVAALKRYEPELYSFFDNRQADLLVELRDKKAIDDDLKKRMISALEQFKKEFTA
jgi:F-type H+-transporting ATPase subunit alpha